jgi:ATP-dependent helicase YprA (DUF1998 family)
VPVASQPYDERREVLRRREQEALRAGLTVVEAKLFAESGQDIGTLRALVRQGCPPELIARIIT